jgi:hypothetical protein
MTRPHAIDRADVMAYVDGQLPAGRAADVGAHLDGCDDCRALADDLRRVSARLHDWRVEAPPAEPGLPRALREAVDHVVDGRHRSWGAGPGRASWPRWSLAAASLAAAVLVVLFVRPDAGPSPLAPDETATRAVANADTSGTGGTSGRAGERSERIARSEKSTGPVPVPVPPAPLATAGVLVDLPGEPVALGAPPPRQVAAPESPEPPSAPGAAPPGVGPPLPDLARQARAADAGGVAAANLAENRRESFEDVRPARTVTLTVTVDDVPAARRALESRAAELGGRVVPGPADPVGAAAPDAPPDANRLSMLLPADRVEAALESLRALGVLSDLGDATEPDAPAARRQVVLLTVLLRTGHVSGAGQAPVYRHFP